MPVSPGKNTEMDISTNMQKIRIPREAAYLAYLPVYLLLFALAEKHITSGYWVSWCVMDDFIPFVKEFVAIYVLWYPLLVLLALWLLWKDRRAFAGYARAIIIGFTACIAIFFILPSGQNLRPAALEGGDVFSAMLRGIYSVDTNTNVLPSMHVVGTMAAIAAAFKTQSLRRPARIFVLVLGVLINASTVLIKQHSALDVFAGIALYALVHPCAYLLPERGIFKERRISQSKTRF